MRKLEGGLYMTVDAGYSMGSTQKKNGTKTEPPASVRADLFDKVAVWPNDPWGDMLEGRRSKCQMLRRPEIDTT